VLRELHQRVVEINDLIQTRPQPLCLAAVASPDWAASAGSSLVRVGRSRSRQAVAVKFRQKTARQRRILANTITCRSQNPTGYQGFLDSSQTTK
jgi:hypothetical protein